MAGSYINPNWNNGTAPAINALNLNNLSNAVVQNQTDIGSLEELTQDYPTTKQNLATLRNDFDAFKTSASSDIAQLKADELKAYEGAFNLPASGWSAEAPYTQTVNAANVRDADKAVLDVALASGVEPTVDNLNAMVDGWNCISLATSGNGTFTFYCANQKPETDLYVQYKIVKKSV